MARLVLSLGLVALLLTALTIAAQVREDPRNEPKQIPGQKVITPDRPGTARNIPGDKQSPAHRGHSRCYLGVCTVPVEDVSNRDRRKLKLKDEEGVLIVEVMPDSPAEAAGLHRHDVILRVNGKETDDEEEFIKDLNELGPGKPVKLTILRDGKKQDITATLKENIAGGENEELLDMCQQNTERIEDLERRIERLENRLRDVQRTRRPRTPE